MTPRQLYDSIYRYVENQNIIICDLHSACSPVKDKSYMCAKAGSQVRVIDFDAVKTKADIESGLESRKSVDAVAFLHQIHFFVLLR